VVNCHLTYHGGEKIGNIMTDNKLSNFKVPLYVPYTGKRLRTIKITLDSDGGILFHRIEDFYDKIRNLPLDGRLLKNRDLETRDTLLTVLAAASMVSPSDLENVKPGVSSADSCLRHASYSLMEMFRRIGRTEELEFRALLDDVSKYATRHILGSLERKVLEASGADKRDILATLEFAQIDIGNFLGSTLPLSEDQRNTLCQLREEAGEMIDDLLNET